MRSESWNPNWLETHCIELSMDGAWRGVETQYIAASMKLVDTLEEQDVLEQLLENSKPPIPPTQVSKHYLLLSPFRYFPQHSSRFRPGQQSGCGTDHQPWRGPVLKSPTGACASFWTVLAYPEMAQSLPSTRFTKPQYKAKPSI